MLESHLNQEKGKTSAWVGRMRASDVLAVMPHLNVSNKASSEFQGFYLSPHPLQIKSAFDLKFFKILLVGKANWFLN